MKSFALAKTLSIIDAKTKLYKEEYYLQRLSQEKLRADRSKIPFSLLIIDIPSHVKPSNGKNHRNDKRMLQLINVLHAVTRETDIKAWYQKDKIAILLLDTPKIGALKLADIVSQEGKKVLNGNLHKEKDLSLLVYTYGDNDFPSSSAPPQSSEVKDTAPHTTLNLQKTKWNPIPERNIVQLSKFREVRKLGKIAP